MAKFKRKKEGLRATCLSFLAGVHSVHLEVLKLLESNEEAQKTVREHYKKVVSSPQAIGLLLDLLNEEELYPYNDEWPAEAVSELLSKIKPLKLKSFDDYESLQFHFKKGFKDSLNLHAEAFEGSLSSPHGSDHWLTSIINTVFFGGATIAAQLAESPKTYYSGVQELEMESEPWCKYPQLNDVFEKQLKRESRFKGGLVDEI